MRIPEERGTLSKVSALSVGIIRLSWVKYREDRAIPESY